MFRIPSSLYATAGALFLLSGCTSIPDLGRLTLPRAAESYATESSFSAPATVWPDDQWWQAYRDPQLTTLIEEGVSGSPTLEEAFARLHVAQAQAEQAGARLWPDLSMSGSASKLKQSYNNGMPEGAAPKGFQDSLRGALDFSYEFDFWGRNRRALDAALSQATAADLDARQARLTLSTSIASAYADLARLYANRDASAQAASVRGQSAELVKKRMESGLENEGSYEQARALRAAAKAETAQLDEQIALQKSRIAALMGASPDRATTIERPKNSAIKPFGLPQNLPAGLLGHRADLLAARLRVEAAAAQIDVARTAFYPNINLSAYIGRQSLGLDLFTKSGSLIGSVGPAIELPIFDSGKISGRYRESWADYDVARALYDQTLNQALHDVSDVAISQTSMAPQQTQAKTAVRAAKRAYDIANQRYKGGLASYLDVLQAENTLIANQRALADLQARFFQLDIALVRALGGGFSDTIPLTEKSGSQEK